MSTDPTAPAAAPADLDHSLAPAQANRLAFALALPLLLLLGGVLIACLTLSATPFPAPTARAVAVFLVCLGLGIAAHEALHALAWAAAGRIPLRRIRFGFSVRALAPYAHVSDPMTARAYRVGAALPAILLGALPYLWGLLAGNAGLAFFGMVFVFAAAGDLLVLWQMRAVDGAVLVRDHPERVGCVVVGAAGEAEARPERPPWGG